jgi:dyslexia susceptibility 1 candidate gene 1 protein
MIEELKKHTVQSEMSKVFENKEHLAEKQQSCAQTSENVKKPSSKPSQPSLPSLPPSPPAPPVRQSGAIEIQFSKRNFSTPKRESQDPAEQEWLQKQAEARKLIGFVADDLRPEERDPMYLKEKGDEFFRKQNYLAAISAYTTGIQIADKCYELYLNRSAAQFAQGNYQRCAEDCSVALELLKPAVPSNLKARVQAFARRGAALSNLGFIKQAYNEFVAAVKLDPSNDILRNDAEMLRAKLIKCGRR